MDIKCFSYCLKELFAEREKVMVPGLGLFFTAMQPASFSDSRVVINPPHFQIHFKEIQSYSQDDCFVNEIIKTLKCSKEQAETELQWCLDRLRNELLQTQVCEIPQLGSLRTDSQNNIFFLPDVRSDDLFIESIGFEPVYVKATAVVHSKEKTSSKSLKPMIVSLLVLIIIVAAIFSIFYFKETNAFAANCYNWIDNAINHILYSDEELELLGL